MTKTTNKQPIWKFTEKTGKLVRNAKTSGIDCYWYGRAILLKKLIPFAKECAKDQPNTIVQEDHAPAHAYSAQMEIYNILQVQQQLLWPGNSPDPQYDWAGLDVSQEGYYKEWPSQNHGREHGKTSSKVEFKPGSSTLWITSKWWGCWRAGMSTVKVAVGRMLGGRLNWSLVGWCLSDGPITFGVGLRILSFGKL